MKANRRADSTPAKTAAKATSEQLGQARRAWRKGVWASLALCAIALFAYSDSFHAEFTLDNGILLQEKQIYEATPQNIRLIFGHTYWWPIMETGLYRPLTVLSLLFNYAGLGNGDHAEGYHWINFVLHAGNILLAFAVAQRLVRRFWPSVFIAGLWAVHPVLTESVTNIVGRADLLAGMSVLGGFLIYLRSTQSQGWRRLAWLGGLLVTTTAGVFSKESAVTVIGVIALYELTWWRERGKIRDLVGGTIATLLPVALFLYQRSVVLAASSAAVSPFVDNPLVGSGFWVGRLTALKVMAHYLALILWPARLSSDYSFAQVPLITGAPGDWIAWLAVCGVGTVLVLLYRRQPAMFFFGLFAFGTFLPTANLLFPIGTIMAERLLYLPAYGLIACLVLTVYWIGERTRMRACGTAVFVLAMLGLSSRTWERNLDWRNNLTLAESSVRASPRSFKAHILLARALYGADPRHSNLDRAIEEGERTIALLDRLPDSQNVWSAYREVAGYYLLKGDGLYAAGPEPASPAARDSKIAWQRAIQLLSRAISILEALAPAPAAEGGVAVPLDSAEAYRTLSGAWLRLSDTKRAYDAAVRARDLNPASSDGYRSIANALRASGRDEDAITALMEGEMLTSDRSLSPEIVLIYRTRFDPGCAITQGPNGPEPDPACPIVRKQICAAVAGAIQVQLRLHRRSEAILMMKLAVDSYGCASDPLERVLATP
jgi:protein O-mannosyl-transferase